jgi:hypothetical protein
MPQFHALLLYMFWSRFTDKWLRVSISCNQVILRLWAGGLRNLHPWRFLSIAQGRDYIRSKTPAVSRQYYAPSITISNQCQNIPDDIFRGGTWTMRLSLILLNVLSLKHLRAKKFAKMCIAVRVPKRAHTLAAFPASAHLPSCSPKTTPKI